MDFYDDNLDYDNGWYDGDDLREMGDREAWEDAQAEMGEEPLNPDDEDADLYSDDPLYEDYPEYEA